MKKKNSKDKYLCRGYQDNKVISKRLILQSPCSKVVLNRVCIGLRVLKDPLYLGRIMYLEFLRKKKLKLPLSVRTKSLIISPRFLKRPQQLVRRKFLDLVMPSQRQMLPQPEEHLKTVLKYHLKHSKRLQLKTRRTLSPFWRLEHLSLSSQNQLSKRSSQLFQPLLPHNLVTEGKRLKIINPEWTKAFSKTSIQIIKKLKRKYSKGIQFYLLNLKRKKDLLYQRNLKFKVKLQSLSQCPFLTWSHGLKNSKDWTSSFNHANNNQKLNNHVSPHLKDRKFQLHITCRLMRSNKRHLPRKGN